MSLFEQLSNTTQSQRQQPMTPEIMRQEVGNLQSNPAAYLNQRGFHIPEGMNDPKEITVHLLRSGQIGSTKLRQVIKMLGAK